MKPGEDSRPLLDRIFPPRYDFGRMLQEQAIATVEGVETLEAWLKTGKLNEPKELYDKEKAADRIRHDLERKLMEAFSTPFDRQNIYELSHQMDQILDFALSTALEMRAFDLPADEAITGMAEFLLKGVKLLSEAIRVMVSHPEEVEQMIRGMRVQEVEMEKLYVRSMSMLLKGGDPFVALKKREIYHHLKDAGRSMGGTIDTIHRIIVSIV